MYSTSSNISALLEKLQAEYDPKNQVVLLMIGEKSSIDIKALIHALREQGIRFFGGIFPGLIYDNQKYEEGIVCKILPGTHAPVLIKDLPELETLDLQTALNIPLGAARTESHSAVVLMDGLSGYGSLFLSRLYNLFGNSVNYLGGGAGSLTLQQQPCIFTDEGIFQDAAVVNVVPMQSHLGVKHGWEQVAGPFITTQSKKNIIQELNWQTAYKTYKNQIECYIEGTLNKTNFFDKAKGFPLGIIQQEGEYIVRDILTFNEEEELICVGEIPENAVLMLLKGEKENLIAAAGAAVAQSLSKISSPPKDLLLFDCISRTLFLEDDFTRELEVVKRELHKVSDASVIPCGALTLGEIASYGDGYIEFFNKTMVTGVFT